MIINRRCLCSAALAATFLLASQPRAFCQEKTRISAGEVAYHYIGRVSLNFVTGKAIIVGYFTTLNGVPATIPLFHGSPSESTALFTFRADADFQPLPGNGVVGGAPAVLPALIAPGDFKVYFTANPSHNWSDPDSFSNGQLVATFLRAAEQLALLGSVGMNTASASITSSERFSLGDVRIDLGRLLARGVTNVTMGNNAPLPGSTPTAPIFGFGGYGVAIGR